MNGLKDKLSKQHKISYKNTEEAGSVNMGEVQDQNTVLEDTIADYSNEDIYNLKETISYNKAEEEAGLVNVAEVQDQKFVCKIARYYC